LTEARGESRWGKLAIEAIGGRQAFEFEPGKPIAVIPLSDSAF
jgi:hypothetical protein